MTIHLEIDIEGNVAPPMRALLIANMTETIKIGLDLGADVTVTAANKDQSVTITPAEHETFVQAVERTLDRLEPKLERIESNAKKLVLLNRKPLPKKRTRKKVGTAP